MAVRFVLLDEAEVLALRQTSDIPREDVEIYLTALHGRADCFVSANRELIQAIAAKKGAFVCLDAEEFVATFLPE